MTFGFHTAVDIATEVIDRIHTTASSHRRCMVIEIMGNKAGWLTLYSGIAGGADIILIPELPYNIENVVDAIKRRSEQGKTFSIIAVAEGAYDVAEAAMKKKERAARRAERGERTATSRIAVLQYGVTYRLKYSGESVAYPTHQQLSAVREERA